jgi:phosphoadenosine phosphosulfate reductase
MVNVGEIDESVYGRMGDMSDDYHGSEEAEDVLGWAIEKFHPRIAVACSFQTTALLHMALQIRKDTRIFAIDTGRLNEETYECAQDVEQRFGIKIEWYFPRHEAVEKLVGEKGLFSFKESLEARHECCAIRKVEPLNRALKGLDAWVTGVRRDQSNSRGEVKKIEVDAAHGGILKINPIADWTTERVHDYVRDNKLPYNRLMEQGYKSIGCACCTRPVGSGEHARAGRWWWEDQDQKECGLHVRNWSI